MRTQCQNCREFFKAPDDYEGRKLNCPKCGNIFMITPISNKVEENQDYSSTVETANETANKKQEDTNYIKTVFDFMSKPRVRIILMSIMVVFLFGSAKIFNQIQEKQKNAKDQKQKEMLSESIYKKEKNIAIHTMYRCVCKIDALVLSVCLVSVDGIASYRNVSPPVKFGQPQESMIESIDDNINNIKGFFEAHTEPPKDLALQHKELLNLFYLIEKYYDISTSTEEGLYRYERKCVKSRDKIIFILKEELSKAKKLGDDDKWYDELNRQAVDAHNAFNRIQFQLRAQLAIMNNEQKSFLESLSQDFETLNEPK